VCAVWPGPSLRAVSQPGQPERVWEVWRREGLPRRAASQRAHALQGSNPHTTKGGGWQGWGHWLGTGTTRAAPPPPPFDEALAVARPLDLANRFEWQAWCKEGNNLQGPPHCGPLRP